MSEEKRKTLLETLKDTVEFFKNRKTVGRMKTEHAIFIPTQLITNSEKETEEFILAAKKINAHEEWHCPVETEPMTTRDIAGVNFIFTFSPNTDFDRILEDINSRL